MALVSGELSEKIGCTMYFLTAKSYFANAKNNSYTHQSVVQFSDKFLEKKKQQKNKQTSCRHYCSGRSA